MAPLPSQRFASLARDTFPNTFSGPIRVDPVDHETVVQVYGTSTASDNVGACNPDTACFGFPKQEELIARLRAGTNGRSALKTEEANDLHRTVLGLGRAHRIAGERGSRCCLRIGWIGLSVAPAHLPVRAVDLDDLHALLA